MKRSNHTLSTIFASAILLFLIIDTKTAVSGASEGISLCAKVIIPSLFPFFIVTSYLNASLLGLSVPGMRSIGKILHIPSGSESLLLLGLIGGYPVGAQLIGETYKSGQLDKRSAHILLGYCNNAGPAFIFGVAGTLFRSPLFSFMLWVLHIISAILTGMLLPHPQQSRLDFTTNDNPSVVQALQKSISALVSVCGWVITFKIILSYLNNWILSLLSQNIAVLVTGILELSNGCLMLSELPSNAQRFILCTIFLAFGGICVALQTKSVTGTLGLGLYLPGKIMQACIGVLIAIPLSWLLFPDTSVTSYLSVLIMLLCILSALVIKIFAEKRYGIPGKNHV